MSGSAAMNPCEPLTASPRWDFGVPLGTHDQVDRAPNDLHLGRNFKRPRMRYYHMLLIPTVM